MKLPYFLTGEGRETVSRARDLVQKEGEKKRSAPIERARQVIFWDRMQKVVTATTILLAGGGTATYLSMHHRDQEPQKVATKSAPDNEPVPLEVKDKTLLDRGIIRIGVRSTPEEKERMRRTIRKALSIVLADPKLAEAYGHSEAVEQLVVSSLFEAFRDLKNMFPKTFNHVDPEKEFAHSEGDAYTVAIEERGPDNRPVRESKNYMLLRQELLDENNFHELLCTLDHEIRHMQYRGKNLQRREEELEVYPAGIARMRRIAQELRKRGGKDAELADAIEQKSIPVHERRLQSWQRPLK